MTVSPRIYAARFIAADRRGSHGSVWPRIYAEVADCGPAAELARYRIASL